MLRGPCGALNQENICMKKIGRCKNHYPRDFCEQTIVGNDLSPNIDAEMMVQALRSKEKI